MKIVAKRKVVFVAVGFVLLVGAVIFIVKSMAVDESSSRPTPIPSNQSSMKPHDDVGVLAKRNVDLLERALNSSSKSKQAQALVAQLRNDDWAASEVLSDNERLVIEPKLRIVTPSYALVNARVTGVGSIKYIIHLINCDGTWLIIDMEKVES